MSFTYSTWADDEHREEHELVRFAITGKGEEWPRLQQRIFGIVDVIAQRIQNSTDAAPNTVEASAETMKDLTALAANWARARIERPSLENEKLKAEIATEFAEAKKRWAEAMKLEAETRQIDIDARNQELVSALDNLERLLNIAKVMSHMTFERVGNDAHLLIGPRAQQLGQPDGGAPLLGEERKDDPQTQFKEDP